MLVSVTYGGIPNSETGEERRRVNTVVHTLSPHHGRGNTVVHTLSPHHGRGNTVVHILLSPMGEVTLLCTFSSLTHGRTVLTLTLTPPLTPMGEQY